MEKGVKYYHGLAGGIPMWYPDEVLCESIRTLKSILKNGGIYCRNDLRKLRIPINSCKQPIYNEDEYVSICVDHFDNIEFQGDNAGKDSSFFRYVKYKVAIELSDSILSDCTFREEPYKKLPGERQILKSIDISHIKRVVIGLEQPYENIAVREITKLCEPYNIPVVTFKELESTEVNTIKRKRSLLDVFKK